MFEKILDILKYPDYQQKSFNIDPYKTTVIKSSTLTPKKKDVKSLYCFK